MLHKRITSAQRNQRKGVTLGKHVMRMGSIMAVLVLGLAASNSINAAGSSVFSVFSPQTSTWSSKSMGEKHSDSKTPAVSKADVLVPSDYDGDGILDFAVWAPETGIWTVKRSSDAGTFSVQWGTTTFRGNVAIKDIPVPADYDGDGRSDIAVWRPETGAWLLLSSSKNFDQSSPIILSLGRSGDIPVPADYDGDKRADTAVFRGIGNKWLISESKAGDSRTEIFGNAKTDVLVPADYTGDGKADIAVYRGDTWYVLNSETNEAEPFRMGFADATPVPADYDGDGQIDFAVFRKGTWFIYESGQPRFKTFNFGGEKDIPLNAILRS